jgi:hypothetical protein
MREPDIWWMLRTGEWIWTEKAVPSVDMFSYTYAGAEWVNVKWLFELIISAFAAVAGAEGIMILQAMATLGIIRFAYVGGRANLQRVGQNQSNTLNPLRWDLAFLGMGIFALLAMDFRFIGRPELVSHFFTAAYLFIFARYARDKDAKGLLWLIPMQLLWANLHEAFGIGMVLMLLFLLGQWAGYALRRWLDNTQKIPLRESSYIAAAILAVMIHPYGFKMLLHPFNIFGQLQENKFTTELANIASPLYWANESYLNFAFLAVSLVGIFLMAKAEKGNILQRLLKAVPPAQGLIYAALFYLSLTAYRNIPFFILAAWWPAAYLIYKLIDTKIFQRFGDKFITLKILIVSGLFYVAIITGVYHQYWRNDKDEYGLQVLRSHNPVGAAEFVAANGLAKTRAYADYLTSSYLLWHLRPDFKTYIDLRDLDVFPSSFFQTFAATTIVPEAFEKEDSTYNFNYVVLFRPQFGALHQYLHYSERYALVFADAVAAVYLKNTPENAATIAKYGFRANGGKDIFTALPPSNSSAISYGLSKIVNPLFSNKNIDKGLQNLFAAEYYQNLQEFGLAENRAKQAVAELNTEKWRGHELLGGIYNGQIATAADPQQRQTLIQAAETEYNKALKLNPEATNALVGKGLIAFQMGQYLDAISSLKKAHILQPDNFSAVKYIAYSYKVRYFNEGQSKVDLENWLAYTKKMDKMNPENPFIILDLGLAFCQLNDCSQTSLYLNKVSEFPQFSEDEKAALLRCLQKCGGK